MVRVLLIDDDALVRDSLAETLADEGVEVDGLASAEDALILLAAGQIPDVLVADIDLGGGLSGLDLARIARERHPRVEVILISGSEPSAREHPAGLRERFLQKPFAPAALVESIRAAATASCANSAHQT